MRDWFYFTKRRDQQPEGGRMGQRGAHAHGRGDVVTGAGGAASLYKHTTPDGTPARILYMIYRNLQCVNLIFLSALGLMIIRLFIKVKS